VPTIHGHTVHGVDVDPQTRCTHYDGDTDVVAIRFPCCDTYYPCHECHDAVTDHQPTVWPADATDTPAVLCGRCGTELTIQAYLECEDTCPACATAFNPGCRNHYHHYFATDRS